MKQYLKHFLIGLLIVASLIGVASAYAPVASAIDCPAGQVASGETCVCPQGQTKTSFDFGGGVGGCVGQGATPEGNTIIVILLAAINFLAVGVGVAVVGGIVWGGFLYTTSNGNAAQSKQGVMVIVNAVIGLLLFAFLYAIVNFLVPGGLFN